MTLSNGTKERYWRTLKGEALRPRTPLSLDGARRVVAAFVEHYNTVRLHSAIGYIAPADMMARAGGADSRGARPQT